MKPKKMKGKAIIALLRNIRNTGCDRVLGVAMLDSFREMKKYILSYRRFITTDDAQIVEALLARFLKT